MSTQYETILVETRGRVGLITLNRPQALNALSDQLVTELGQAVHAFDADADVGCIVVTGSQKAFAAGADIKEMADKGYSEVFKEHFISAKWEEVTKIRTPIIAAVAGYALGGGCELAMMCDFIIAAENAKFGQPEITIGTIPGAGGTQRLTRLVGKSKAMDMCLTGRLMKADEAERCGLVSRVFAVEDLVDEAVKIGEEIASRSAVATKLCKASVNAALETTLAQGINFERNLFWATFATEDQKEGMNAFIEKRDPHFKGE